MPPPKQIQDGKVDLHANHGPLTAPLAFVAPSVVSCSVSGNVCLWNLEDDSKHFLYTSVLAITKLAGNVARGYVAFSEGGTDPNVYVYSLEPAKLLFTVTGVAELEIADLSFSRCGSRLYVLTRATSKRLKIYSTVTGKELPGTEVTLPQRFDKVSVFPGHKDQVALVRSSSVRILRIQKSYETYVTKLQPSSLPSDIDLTVTAYTWTAMGHFVFGTRQDYLVTLDGLTGAVLHVCQVTDSITSITATKTHLITSHSGSVLKVWTPDPPQLDGATQFQSAPPMDQCGAYELAKVCDMDAMGRGQPLDTVPIGQVVHIQASPDYNEMIFTTIEGEVWRLPLSELVDEANEGVEVTSLPMQFLTWFHAHTVTDLTFLGKSCQVGASVDEGGRLRLWEVTRSEEPKGMTLVRFTSALTSLAADDHGRVLVVGSASGCVHVVNTMNWRRAQVTDTCRCSEAGVAKLSAVTMEGRCLYVAAALFNRKIALMTVSFKTATKDPKVQMLGLVDAMGSIEDMCFHAPDFNLESLTPPKLILVGTAGERGGSKGCPAMWAIRGPPIDYEPAGVEVKSDAIQVWSMKLAAEGRAEDVASAVASASRKSVVVGFASGAVKVYAVPSTQEPPTNVHLYPVAEAMNILDVGHTQLITRLCVSSDSGSLVTSSMDGTTRRIPLEGSAVGGLAKLLHNPYHGGVTQVAASKDSSILLTTGGTDGVLVWSDLGSQVEIPPVAPEDAEDVVNMEAMPITEIDDMDASIFPVWAPVLGEEKEAEKAAETADPELNAVALAQRKALVLEVESLRKKLRLLVDANSQCPDLEKLERAEFCVDFEERDAIAQTTKERCDALRAQIDRDNLARQLTRDRLIKEFWDPMRIKGCQICSLMSSLSVSNYPERAQSQEEQTTLKKLRIMRQVESLEVKMLQGSGTPPALKGDMVMEVGQYTTGEEEYIVNWWQRQSGPQMLRSDTTKDIKDGNGGEQQPPPPAKEGGGSDSVDQNSVQRLLYDPFELMTNSRRRCQIQLLQSLAVEYRTEFNDLFKQCQGEKHGTIDQMKEKLGRIRAILAELQMKEDVQDPKPLDAEDSNSVLQVKDTEIKAEKWLSEAEKKALQEAKQREEERLRQLRENDAGQRALMQMMGGTLKTKKDLSPLEIVLDREPWMDQVAEDDMTDAQKQALKDYQDKEKALAEEQDKYRKQLDAELKKLRQDVQELMQHFESALKELQHQRFVHDAKVFCQELYCVRLQLALLQNVEDDNVLKTLLDEVAGAKQKLSLSEDALEAFREKVDAMREKQDERVRHEKEVSSAGTFRAAFANSGLEPEAVGQLLHMFRRRKDGAQKGNETSRDQTGASRRRRSSAGSQNFGITGTVTMGSDAVGLLTTTGASVAGGGAAFGKGFSLDALSAEEPYTDLGVPSAEAAPEEAAEEEVAEECPEGVDEVNFRKMLDLRRERYQAEAEVAKGTAVLNEMSNLFTHLQKERDDAEAEEQRLEQELSMHRDLMDRERFDIEILFKLKQGQVEVPQAAVVTDYSDAVVINQEVVESRNRRIVELGQEKTGTLETIKEFRKKLNLIQWEHKMLALQTKDLEERTKDVHMLRVTKGLQSLLKGGEEGRNKADADLLERKIEHLSTTTVQKESNLKKQYAINQRAAKMRKMENSMLEKKLRELQQNVIQREHIRRLRAPTSGGASGPSRKEGEKPRIIGGGGQIEENEGEIRAAQAQFREVKIRTGLMDVVKRHTEEIELLRKELDRLRQKTFPSFVQLHEDRPANPDHVG
mmetsp:Transcript_38744/g.91098  ORF Transcript_38744/g.91098 Transcript_38744/m.91098 type:complete len:1764 (-) Transcript_38744:52-5343(-)